MSRPFDISQSGSVSFLPEYCLPRGGSAEILRLLIVLLIFMVSPHSANASGVVSRHGRLQAQGNRLVDRDGRPISLAGASLFWGNEGWHGQKFWNAEVVRHLAADWSAALVRAPMGVEDPGGFLEFPESNRARLLAVVEACLEADIYVIIDWHSHDAEAHRAEAVAFFRDMARRFGKHDHVIYEIWNEPRHVEWAATIKPYAEEVIKAIREHDPDNLIVVGSGDWSTEVDVAAADPLIDPNVAYSFHFYAASHRDEKRQQAQRALDLGKPLFVTEWGSCESNGDGRIDAKSTEEWMRWMKINGISHCNWAVNDKAEAASALQPGSSTRGGWREEDLTASGQLARHMIRGWLESASTGQRPDQPAGEMLPR